MKKAAVEKLLRKRVIKNGCWIWTGTLFDSGYGSINIDGKRKRVHRVSFEAHGGELIPGLVLDHVCRTKSCFNPEHLRQVDNFTNATENSESCSALNLRKTHCIHGHKLDGENLYKQPGTNYRYCRECQRHRAREWARRKAKEMAKKKNQTTGDIEVLPVIERELKVELTPAQSKERLVEACELQTIIDDSEKEKEELVANHKAALDALKETIEQSETRKSQLCRGVSLVKCEPVKNYETKMLEFWHPTFAHGKKYDERPFTAEEHQKAMFEDEAEAIPASGSDPFASEGANA